MTPRHRKNMLHAAKSFKIPSSALSTSLPIPSNSNFIIFAHGFLGSRFDMLHLCELLASRGYTVLAPELPESISNSFETTDGVSRDSIVDATMSFIRRENPNPRFGIFGHSMGGGTAAQNTNSFPLGRVSIAGYRPGATVDPTLIVASEGDMVIPLNRITTALPPSSTTVTFTGEPILDIKSIISQHNTISFIMSEISTDPGLFQTNHISFLSPSTNDALVSGLRALIPLAKALKMPLLDMDLYMNSRDSAIALTKFQDVVLDFYDFHSKNNKKI